MSNEQERQVGQALAQAAVDFEFRERLIADPAHTLRGTGVEIPGNLEVELVEVSESRMVLVVPPYEGDQLSEEELAEVAGGKSMIRDEVRVPSSSGLFSWIPNELWSLPPIQNQHLSRKKEQ